MLTYVLVVTAVSVLIYAIVIYKGLVGFRRSVAKARSNVEVLLRQRYEGLTQLIEACNQQGQFKIHLLQQLVQAGEDARTALERGDLKAVAAAEGPLRSGLLSIGKALEAGPELRASESRTVLDRILGLNKAIADRHDFYNDSVRHNNARIEQFPDAIVARLATFKPAESLVFPSEGPRDVETRRAGP